MNTSVYDKLQKVLDDRNVEGYLGLIHDDAQIIFHKSGDRCNKSEWVSVVGGMMRNPKFVKDASRCIYEDSDMLVSDTFMSYPGDTKEAVMLVCMLKDGQIIRMETR